MKKAVYCGSFNPITIGHVNVISRASKLADTLYVVVLNNAEKEYEISLKDRVEMTSNACAQFKNVLVDSFGGALIDFCEKIGCNVVIKSIRNRLDLQYEEEMAQLNKQFGGIETIYLTADEAFVNISSSLVREKAKKGESINGLVPCEIAETVKNLLASK